DCEAFVIGQSEVSLERSWNLVSWWNRVKQTTPVENPLEFQEAPEEPRTDLPQQEGAEIRRWGLGPFQSVFARRDQYLRARTRIFRLLHWEANKS
ncbi:MAG: hypothetical protein KDA36_12465, partial [Planctomycetaceae bacterium]|nr:hypothetical protein [Planctomycetaceae bacterium]